MFDLSQAKVLGNEEVMDAPIVEAPVETGVPSSSPADAPVGDSDNKPAETAPVVAPSFPTERFGGKYKNWDEVDSALGNIKEPVQNHEYLQKIIDKWNADGDLKPFFQAHATDYDQLSDDEVLRRDFYEKNSTLSDKGKAKLWEDERLKYKTDSDEFTEDEVELALELRKRDADKLRLEGKENQKQYLQPNKVEAPAFDKEGALQQVNSLPEIQKLRADKKLTLSVDGNLIEYDVEDTDFIVNTTVDYSPFDRLFDQGGKLNAHKWATVMEFARNPEKMMKAVLDQGKTLGRLDIEKELKNPDLSTQTSSSPANPGDFNSRLLEAFATRGQNK